MMKHVLAAAVTSAALLMASGALADGGPEPPPPPPPVYEPPPPPVYNWYTTVFAGAAFSKDLEQDVVFLDPIDPADDEFFFFDTPTNTGYYLGWTIGYRPVGLFGSSWFSVRPEVELSFRQRRVDFDEVFADIDVLAIDLDGDGIPDIDPDLFDADDPFNTFADPADVVTLLFNGWLDFSFFGVNPYLGGGVGIGWANMPNPGSFLPQFSSSDFVWQVGGGINYNLNERVFVGVGYRYLDGDTEDSTSFLIAGPIGEPVDTVVPLDGGLRVSTDYDTHHVLFNLGVRF